MEEDVLQDDLPDHLDHPEVLDLEIDQRIHGFQHHPNGDQASKKKVATKNWYFYIFYSNLMQVLIRNFVIPHTLKILLKLISFFKL